MTNQLATSIANDTDVCSALSTQLWTSIPDRDTAAGFLRSADTRDYLEELLFSVRLQLDLRPLRADFVEYAQESVAPLDKSGAESLFLALETAATTALRTAGTASRIRDKEAVKHARDTIEHYESLRTQRRRHRLKASVIRATVLRIHKRVLSANTDFSPEGLDRSFESATTIEQIYVPPSFCSGGAAVCPLTEVTADINRLLVLGDPGGGKSTLTRYLCFQQSLRGLAGEQNALPLLIPLRRYTQDSRGFDAIAREILQESEYQVTPRAAEYLIESGRVMMIFDGLDEVLDRSQRRDTVARIATIAALRERCPIVVTSRAVGYGQSPLPEEFKSFCIQPFSDEQVEQYVSKWFTIAEQPEFATRFMIESEHAEDLRSNPLMLSLMCSLYKGSGYIPRNRPEIYEKCSLLMFDRWDRTRAIPTNFGYDDLAPALRRLASDMQAHSEHRMSLSDMRTSLTSLFAETRTRNRDQNLARADAILEVAQGRHWIFDVAGKSSSGEDCLTFRHSTFQEYFYADWLVKEADSSEALASTLMPLLISGARFVVCDLATQIYSRQRTRGADALLRSIHALPPAQPGAIYVAQYFVRSIHDVLLHEDTQNLLLAYCATTLADAILADYPLADGDALGASLGNLAIDMPRVRQMYLDEALAGSRTAEQGAVLLIRGCIFDLVQQETVQRFVADCASHYATSQTIAAYAHFSRMISVDALVNFHGPDSFLFRTALGSISVPAPIGAFIDSLEGGDPSVPSEAVIDKIASLLRDAVGTHLPDYLTPGRLSARTLQFLSLAGRALLFLIWSLEVEHELERLEDSWPSDLLPGLVSANELRKRGRATATEVASTWWWKYLEPSADSSHRGDKDRLLYADWITGKTSWLRRREDC